MSDKSKKYRPVIIDILVVVVFLVVVEFAALGLSSKDLTVPFSYRSDGMSPVLEAVNMHETGLSMVNNRLAAPFNQDNSTNASSSYIQRVSYVYKIVLANIINDSAVTANIIVLFIPVFNALVSYFVMKSLGINRLLSILGSVTFGFCPYVQQRLLGHACLAAAEFVPLTVLLCFWCATDPNFNSLSKGFFKSRRNLLGILFAFLIANNGILYYPYFSCFFLCITAVYCFVREKNGKSLVRCLIPVFEILFFIVINFIPFFFQAVSANSGLAESVKRDFVHAQIYGLRISTLFLSPNGFGTNILKKLYIDFTSNSVLINENAIGYLGLIGMIGFAVLLIALIAPRKQENAFLHKITFLSGLNIAAILLGTIAGFGGLIAFFFPQFRAYNRISIFVAFFCILAVCLLAQRLLDFLPDKMKFFSPEVNKKILSGFLTVCFLGGFVEQVSINISAEYTFSSLMWKNDNVFFPKIEKSVSENAMIFELPYMSYPENGSIGDMNDYAQFVGYIHTDTLRWSYGAVKGTMAAAWNSYVSGLSVEQMLKVLSLTGFEGIYIDRRGYDEKIWKALESELVTFTGAKPIVSPTGYQSFFPLADYTTKYKKLYTSDEWVKTSKDILNIRMETLTGIYSTEGVLGAAWNWCSPHAEISVNSINVNGENSKLKLNVNTAVAGDYLLTVECNGEKYTYSVGQNTAAIEVPLSLRFGANKVTLFCDAPRLDSSVDSRDLCFRLANLPLGIDVVPK